VFVGCGSGVSKAVMWVVQASSIFEHPGVVASSIITAA